MNPFPPPAVPTGSGSAVVDAEPDTLSLLDEIDYAALTDFFGAFYREGQYRVVVDCSHLERLGPVEVRTLIRFADQFAQRGGFIRLTHVSARIRGLFAVFRCTELLIEPPSDHRSSGGSSPPAARGRLARR